MNSSDLLGPGNPANPFRFEPSHERAIGFIAGPPKGFDGMDETKPLLEQGSSHYRRGGIQPIEFIEANQIPFHEANIIKYVFRWKDKDGVADLEKALWYLKRLIELNAVKQQGFEGIDEVVKAFGESAHGSGQ